jgi:hypothetical protein
MSLGQGINTDDAVDEIGWEKRKFLELAILEEAEATVADAQ